MGRLPPDCDVSALILAGGRGTRLGGRDKGLLRDHDGKWFARSLYEQLVTEVDRVYISANRNQRSYASIGAAVLDDELSGFQGPLAGIYTALGHAPTSWVLTVPCDSPAIPQHYVSRMLDAIQSASRVVIAHDGERAQAVYALIPTRLRHDLGAFLGRGDRKLMLWLSGHSPVYCDFADQPAAFFNLNTPADATRYEAGLAPSNPPAPLEDLP